MLTGYSGNLRAVQICRHERQPGRPREGGAREQMTGRGQQWPDHAAPCWSLLKIWDFILGTMVNFKYGVTWLHVCFDKIILVEGHSMASRGLDYDTGRSVASNRACFKQTGLVMVMDGKRIMSMCVCGRWGARDRGHGFPLDLRVGHCWSTQVETSGGSRAYPSSKHQTSGSST